MEPDRGVLEEVGEFLLAAPQFLFGSLALDELAEVPGDGPHHLQKVGVRVVNALREEFDYAERLFAHDNRTSEGAVQAVVYGGGESWEVAISGNVEYPGRFAAGPHPARKSLA